MSPIHFIEGNLLYSKSINLNMLISSKNTFTETSRIMVDQISGYYGLAKLTRKLIITNIIGFIVFFLGKNSRASRIIL